jgi:hypothetical protein
MEKVGDTANSESILFGKPEWNRPFGKHRHVSKKKLNFAFKD